MIHAPSGQMFKIEVSPVFLKEGEDALTSYHGTMFEQEGSMLFIGDELEDSSAFYINLAPGTDARVLYVPYDETKLK